ncbi:predicted GTPase [Microbacterium testaceum StLB037]|uniref:Predicted GTPase n=1 Tax=Microbacterium testaceum (strain StLB037) TaxID=979556 RepID=E8NFV1_MICTS|nr:hypothetical protein [Microbacterium testaceum]BAJ73996.1 predicted GTPase [Microbacterium testaceum StLB037]
MTNTHAIVGIEGMPVFLVAENDPRLVSEDEFVSGVPLADLIDRLQPGEHVYLVDYTSVPGQTRLTRLASRSDRD